MRFVETVLLGLPVALAAPAQTPGTISTTATSTSSCTDEYKPTSRAHTYGYGYPVYNVTVTASSATYSIKSYSASSSGSSASLTTSSGGTSSSETQTGSFTTATGTSSSATDLTTSSPTISETETTITTISSTTTTSSAAPTITGIDALPECGRICLSDIIANPTRIGCPVADPSCLCTKANFFNAIHDCSVAVCGGEDAAAPAIAFGAALCAAVIATFTPTTTTTNPPVTIPTPAGIENLPACGQACINNMLSNYADPNINCATPDPACICTKPNFFNGIRDCSQGACGAVGVDAGPVIAFGNNYCAPYTGGNTTPEPNPNPQGPVVLPTVPGIETQPECGKTCINNMIALYNDPNVGCPTADKACFCSSSGFFNGLGACSAGACQGNQDQIDGVFQLINGWCSS